MSPRSKAEFHMTRRFRQPLETVWQAWSEADRFRQWWGPKGCRIELHRFEFRPGGFLHYAMVFPEGPAMWGRFAIREIAPRERLVWLNSFSNERCGIARAPFSEDCPLEIQNTVSFAEEAGQTIVTLHAVPFGELDSERVYFEELHPSLEQGYGSTFDALAEYLQRD
ncbi:MAG TPA: SRPBCC domain-containing protein [Variovorax sp.]|nr:SRPBCC domain-containing protein [Variovorax sp.]